ncbi:MAG: hypothetical protein HY911_06950 [Desulfobacterales bacterium]|nr:hypothetical protein [Desulfobacterales bacterium]
MTEVKKKVNKAEEKTPPKAAEPLDQCTLSSTPEHVRADDLDEPCDDGRAG